MSKIIMFGNQKGGVGKSQCTVLAATALSMEPWHNKVAVIDVDSQKSVFHARRMDARTYKQTKPPFSVLDFDIKGLQSNIKALDQSQEVVFIDVAGKLDTSLPVQQQEISKALMYVDYLFIPFVAGNYNLESTIKYLEFVNQVAAIRQNSNRPLHTTGFVNMYRGRTVASRYLMEDLSEIKKAAGIPIMKTPLNNYTLFNDADTYTSLYNPDTYETPKINFLQWVNELCKIAKLKKNG